MAKKEQHSQEIQAGVQQPQTAPQRLIVLAIRIPYSKDYAAHLNSDGTIRLSLPGVGTFHAIAPFQVHDVLSQYEATGTVSYSGDFTPG